MSAVSHRKAGSSPMGGCGGALGGGGVDGGDGAQHLVRAPPVKMVKYCSSSFTQWPSEKGVAQSGHGHCSPFGTHEPPVDAQQTVFTAHRPAHESANPAFVQLLAQRGYSNATPVSSLNAQ